MKLAIQIAVALLSCTAIYVYFRPPQGDVKPLTAGVLKRIRKLDSYRGDIGGNHS